MALRSSNRKRIRQRRESKSSFEIKVPSSGRGLAVAQIRLEIVLSRFDGNFRIVPRPSVFLHCVVAGFFVFLFRVIDWIFQSRFGLVAHRRRRLLKHPSLLGDEGMDDDGGFGGYRRRFGGRGFRGFVLFQIYLTKDVFHPATSLNDVLHPSLNAETFDDTASRSVPRAGHPEHLPTLRDGFSVFVLSTSVNDLFRRLHQAFISYIPTVSGQRLIVWINDRFFDNRHASCRHQSLTPFWNGIRFHQKATSVQ